MVVLNWERFNETKRCVNSLLQNGYADLQVIVVDNGSKDGSLKELRNEFPDLTIVANEANLGFAKGCNVGIRKALEDINARYILLLNNDATLRAGTLERAVRFADKRPEVGAVSGKVLFSGDQRTIWYSGAVFDRWRGRATSPGFGKTDDGRFDLTGETELLTGAMLLVKRAVLERIGLLCEQYFFGYEEWDFSFRVKAAGFKIFYVPEFVAYHTVDGSHDGAEPKFIYNAYRNKLILQETYLPRLVFPLWKSAFRFYGKFLARGARVRLMARHPVAVPRQPPLDNFTYALERAIKDHGKNQLSEAVLSEFERDLLNRPDNEGRSRTA